MIEQIKRLKASAASQLCLVAHEISNLEEQLNEKKKQYQRLQGELFALARVEQLAVEQSTEKPDAAKDTKSS